MRDNRPVLVTGANGFIGSSLTEALLEKGYQVRCMVRRNSDLRFIRDLPVEWAYGDVCDPDSLRQACQGVGWVCHCAALTRAPNEETFFRVNALGTEALGRATLENSPDLERFLLVSSQTAVGPASKAGEFLEESAPPHPLTSYGRSKWAGERALLSMNGQDGHRALPLTIIRPAIVFGPRDVDLFTYFQLVKFGLRLDLGRGDRWISLIYVSNLVDLCLRALENEVALGQTYCACDMSLTYTELSLVIARVMGRRTVPVRLPEAVLGPMSLGARVQQWLTGKTPLLNEQRIKDMRQRYWLCSGDKARRELGFVPQCDLPTAVQETADWYLENGWL